MNFIVTFFNLRAKGMRLFRVPVFIWMTLVVAFLLLFSLPIIAIALFMVTFDRQFGTLFFDATAGGDPILWQHLFWLFGHPEVYILILPAMGIVSEIIPVFSRKPLFGYAAVVFAGAGIAFLGFGVWAHHMFASGISTVAQVGFGITTMTIAIPTGVKIFNWLGTLWLGRIRSRRRCFSPLASSPCSPSADFPESPTAVVPSDWQQTRHLLHRRPLPLRLVRWLHLRYLRRPLLLVPQIQRAHAQRQARQGPFLALDASVST